MDEELNAFDQCTSELRAALVDLRECKSIASQMDWVKKLAEQKRDQLVRQVNDQLKNVTFVCKSVIEQVAPESVILDREDAIHVNHLEEEEEEKLSDITRKRKSRYVYVPEDDDEDEDDDDDDDDNVMYFSSESSFVEEDKSEGELPVYDNPLMEAAFAGRPPASKRRVPKPPARFSPPPQKKLSKEDREKEEDIGVGSVSKYELDSAELFWVRAPSMGLRRAIADSYWFRSSYSVKLDQIRNNLGLQTADSIAHQTWDCMYNGALDHCLVGGIELNNYKRKDTCCLCGYQRQCSYTIKLPDNTRGLLGDKCAGLAFAWNAFLSTLIDVEKFASGRDFMKKLDSNMFDLQQAQENKTLDK